MHANKIPYKMSSRKHVPVMYTYFSNLCQNIDCGYLLESPWRGGSNVYPQSMLRVPTIYALSKNKKNIKFSAENFIFFKSSKISHGQGFAMFPMSWHKYSPRLGIALDCVMVRASASGAGGHGFDPGPGHTNDFKNGTSGYLAWRSAL